MGIVRNSRTLLLLTLVGAGLVAIAYDRRAVGEWRGGCVAGRALRGPVRDRVNRKAASGKEADR